MIDFIEQRCWEFVNTYQTEEFGDDILWFTRKLEESWTKFLVWYYEFLDGFATIRLSNLFQINVIIITYIFMFDLFCDFQSIFIHAPRIPILGHLRPF